MNLEVGDLILCTVDRIVGTNVFVRMTFQGKEIEGTIIFSEIAPGRIRNIRDYVVPKKQIACKVLRISGDRIDLSFRRVTLKEKKELKEKAKQEKSYEKILERILGDKTKKVIEDITKNERVYDFLQEAKTNSKELEKMIGKKDSEKILEILNAQKKKKVVLRKEISLTTTKSDGIELIKNLLSRIKDVDIKYVSAGRYTIKKESEDIKKSDNELTAILSTMEKEAKKKGMELSILKK
ncbi:MAG TPA: hypothetical protein ENI22_00385 [Candidatus Pacearchaeota archaeon]|nr:hypothetical protein [Candidatus Pacearchaeota archaeon]